MMDVLMRLFVLAIFGFIIAAGASVRAASLSQKDMIDFLAQSLCLDASGHTLAQIPILDSCKFMRPQLSGDIAIYRKHDWPDTRQPGSYRLGHQASDSVLLRTSVTPVVEQTFDFGGASGREFEHFDSVDGGQVVLLMRGWATAVMTQDPTGGVQWFIGNGCRRSRDGGKLSWLFFNQDVPSDRWGSVVANAGLAHFATECPLRFNLAYTRFRRDTVSFPFRVVSDGTVTKTNRPLDVIISEHFGGGAPDAASNAHLERFYFARHLGWIRWERWENTNSPTHAVRAAADLRRVGLLKASGRCPAVSYSTPPGPGWEQVDCRTWTTMVKLNKPWRVSDFHWHAAEDADWR